MLVVAAPWRSLLYRIDTKTYQPIRYRTRENSRKILGTREGKEREGDAENLGESRRDAGVPSSGEPPTRIRTEYTRRFATFPSHGGRGMGVVRVRGVQEPKPQNQALSVSNCSKLLGIESIHERA